MKKKIVAVIIIFILLSIILYVGTRSKNKVEGNENLDDKISIFLDKEEKIKQLVEYQIEDTNGTLYLERDIKYMDSSINGNDIIHEISYRITSDGNDYYGIYDLNNGKSQEIDKNCKYELNILDIDKDGIVTIKLNEK